MSVRGSPLRTAIALEIDLRIKYLSAPARAENEIG
jgi:hypothetical protein